MLYTCFILNILILHRCAVCFQKNEFLSVQLNIQDTMGEAHLVTSVTYLQSQP